MTQTEIVKILAVIKTIFPNFYKDKADMKNAVNGWYLILGEYDYEIAQLATKAVLQECKYPPTPADIIEKIRVLTAPPRLSEAEAWNMVIKATANTTYHAVESFNTLPPEVRSIVGSPSTLREWAQNTDALHTVIKSHFAKEYREQQAADVEREMLPEDSKKFLEEIKKRHNGAFLQETNAENPRKISR